MLQKEFAASRQNEETLRISSDNLRQSEDNLRQSQLVLSQEVEALTGIKGKLETELDTIKSAQTASEDISTELENLRESEARLRAELDTVKQSEAQIKAEATSLLDSEAQLKQEVRLQQGELDQLREQVKSSTAVASASSINDHERERLQKMIDELTTESDGLNKEVLSLQDQVILMDALEEEMMATKDEVKVMEDRMIDGARVNELIVKVVKQAEEEINKLQTKLIEVLQEKEMASMTLIQSKDAAEQAKTRVEELEAELKTTKETLENTKNELVSAKERRTPEPRNEGFDAVMTAPSKREEQLMVRANELDHKTDGLKLKMQVDDLRLKLTKRENSENDLRMRMRDLAQEVSIHLYCYFNSNIAILLPGK